MAEWKFFGDGVIPECSTPEWYAGRDTAPHIDQPNHRPRLELARAHIVEVAERYEIDSLVDLGAGDGGLLSILPPDVNGWGYDLQPSNVVVAERRGVNVVYADVLNDRIMWGDIAVATEMLEHLVDPRGFVRRVAGKAQALVASSPKDETPDDHYEHHLWAWDMYGYRWMLEESGMIVIRHDQCGPFQVVTAVSRTLAGIR